MGEAAPDRRGRRGGLGLSRTVRDATFDVFRRRGLTTIFSNPGSTEVPFLAGLPDDLRFVLALHEGSVVGLATGYAIGRGEPALALAAHDGRARQRRRRARDGARQPRAARRRRRPAGPPAPRLRAVPRRAAARASPASTRSGSTSPCARRTSRARSSARTTRPRPQRGPALVIVPMDDWLAPADEEREDAAAGAVVLRARGADPAAVDELAALPRRRAESPALVVGAGADDAGDVGGARRARGAARRAGLPGVVRRAAPASRRTTRSSPASCPPTGRGCARGSRRYDASSSSARRSSASRRTTPGRFTEPGTRIARRQRRPRRGAPQPGRARRARAAGRGLPRARATRLPQRDAAPPEPFRPPPRRRRRRPASR